MLKIQGNTITFTDDFGNTSSNFKANAGDRITISFDLEESIYFISSNSETITSSTNQRANNILQFPNYNSMNGFAVGQTVVLTKTLPNLNTTTNTVTIISINYNTFEIKFSDLLSPASADLNLYDGSTTMQIYTTATRQDLYVNLNYNKSSSTNVYGSNGSLIPDVVKNQYAKSLIDGSLTRFFYASLGSISVGDDRSLSQIGYKSGHIQASINVERLANVNTYTRLWRFTITTTQIGGLFPDGWLQPDSQFLKMMFQVEWYTITGSTSNPTLYTWNLVNSDTGRFDQPFYLGEVDSELVSYTNNQILFDDEVTNTVVINSNSSDIGIGAFYYPNDQSYYKNKFYTQAELCMYLSGGYPISVTTFSSNQNPGGAGYYIEIISHSYTLGVHTLVFKTIPNAAFSEFMQERDSSDRKFLVWVRVGSINHLLTESQIEAAPIPNDEFVDYKPEPTDPVAVFQVDKLSVEYEAELITDGLECSKQDNALMKLSALLPKSDTYKNAKFEVIVAEKTDLENYFVLESMFFDFSGQTLSPDGTLNVNMTQSRGDNMPSTSGRFLRAQITRQSDYSDTLTHFTLTFLYPFLVNWRYWINQANAYSLFYPNQNKDWFNYMQDADYQIYVKTTLDATTRLIQHHAPIKTIHDYNESFSTANEEWAGEASITYLIEDFQTVVPCLIQGKVMRVRVVLEKQQPATLSTIWGQMSIQQKENDPIWFISTNYPKDANQLNPFIPIPDEDRLFYSIDVNDVTFEVLVNTNKLSGVNQNITLKFYNDAASPPIEQVRLLFETKLVSLPFPNYGIEDQIRTERGYESCCNILRVFAHPTDTEKWKNDKDTAFVKLIDPLTDSVEFEIYKDNEPLTYQPTKVEFPNEEDAYYATVDFQSVFNELGYGYYEFRVIYTGSISQTIIWNTYLLEEYSEENTLGLVSIRGVFNQNQQINGINFTGSNIECCLNLDGMFGGRDPRTNVKNIVLSTGTGVTVKNEHLNEYTLTTDNITDFWSRKLLDFFALSATEFYITDHTAFNHNLYVDFPVKLDRVEKPEYNEQSEKAKFTIVFTDRTNNQKSFF